MKRFLFLVLICILLVSCATTGSSHSAADEIVTENLKTTPVRGKCGELKPNWIVEDFTTEDVLFGVGYAKLSNEDDARKLAKAEAKNELAEKVFTLVEETISTNKTKSTNSHNISSVQTSRAYLSGAVVEDEWVSKEGTVYVLMSIPTKYIESQIAYNTPDLNVYIKNSDDKTLWDTFKNKLQGI